MKTENNKKINEAAGEILIQCEEMKKLQEKAFAKEREVVKMISDLEKELFNGMSYSQYLNTIKDEIINGKFKITLNRWNIEGEYFIADDIVIKASSTVYNNGFISNCSVEYPNKSLKDIPKKYQKEFEALVAEMKKYRIYNICDEIREKYKIHRY